MPGPQTPRPPRPPPSHDPKKNPLGYIVSKWRDFTRQAETGSIEPNNAKSIRMVLAQQPRGAVLQGLLALKTNIFVNMHPLLDPRVEHDGPPALTPEQYARENALAIEDLKALSLKQRNATSQAGSSNGAGTGTSQQGSSPAGTPIPQTGGASPNPTSTGSPRPVANTNPPVPPASNPQAMGRPPIRPQPLPEGMMTLADVRRILAMGEPQRQVLYLRSPGLKEKFTAALLHFQAMSARNNEAAAAKASAGGVRPSTPAPSTGPSTPSSSQNQNQNQNQNQSQNQTQPTTTNQNAQSQNQNQNQPRPPAQQTPARPPQNTNPHAATPTPNPNPTAGIPNRPFNLNLPPQRQGSPMPPQQPPPPVENERSRRKRKFREYVKEEAPGLEVEVGVDQIVSDYLDAFIDEAARGAIRLSKHRKSAKVELKDMALFLDVTHDVRLPGFNVQLPHRQHISADTERKRGKAVAPRAARKGKEVE